MAKYRARLPQEDGGLFLTDAGIETTLIFEHGLELPYFAAFALLKEERREAGFTRLFRAPRRDRQGQGLGLCSREPNLARERRLGPEARLYEKRARGGEPRGDRHDGGAPRPLRERAHAHGHQRLRGSARRRLRPRQSDERKRGRGLSRRADRRLREERCRSRHGHHHDQRARGDRRRARRACRRHARRHLLHRRRPTAGCPPERVSTRPSRPWTRRRGRRPLIT